MFRKGKKTNGTEQVLEEITAGNLQVWQQTNTQIHEVKQILEIELVHRALHWDIIIHLLKPQRENILKATRGK